MHVCDEIMRSEQKMRSYLRGAFLAGGSINNPKLHVTMLKFIHYMKNTVVILRRL